MRQKPVHKIKLAKTIKDFGFAATIEIASVMDLEYFKKRFNYKLFQAGNSRQYVQDAYNLYKVVRAQEAKSYISDIAPENFEVVGGLAFLTREMPDFDRKDLDFSIRANDTDIFMYLRAYEHMLSQGHLDKKSEALAKRILLNSRRINIVRLFRNYYDENENAANIIGMEREKFKAAFSNTRGHFAESYFNVLFGQFLTDFLILPRVHYRYRLLDEKQKKCVPKQSEIDLLIACPREQFYDTLYVMARTHPLMVDYNFETIRLHSGFFIK